MSIERGSGGSPIDLHKPLNVCRASAGTGKTFTLAAYYVGLLLSGVDYRSILAITFTNKATAEMRERIMGYLYAISQGGEQGFLERAKEFMISSEYRVVSSESRVASDEVLRERAGECFNAMLLDYDNVQVQTIDSFLQTLLSGLASILKLDVGLQTELDINHIVTTAVDQLITVEMTDEVQRMIEDYLMVKLDNDTRWDMRKSIRSMAMEMYNESVQMLEAEGQIEFEAEKIELWRNKIEESLGTHPLRAGIEAQLAVLANYEAELETIPNGKAVLAAQKNIHLSLTKPEELRASERFRGLTDNQMEKVQSGKWAKLPQAVLEAIERATELIRQYRKIYNTAQLTIAFSRDMQLMGTLRTLIQRNLTEANCALLAQTANTLYKALKQGDADFILEKVGIRYKHVLIDEFQDTSALQWRVISQLLRDILANTGNTVLIVGDIKQSIYRWRNGDWHIMESLGKDEAHFQSAYNPAFPPLRRNFRSSENVVKFNLGLFKYITEQYEWDKRERELIQAIYGEDYAEDKIDSFYQSNKKKGGIVRFRAFVQKGDELVLDMFDTIEERLAAGEQQSDMMILVREKKEAQYIVAIHRDILASDSTRYNHVRGISFVSADSFQLEASQAVQVIIAALRYIWHSNTHGEDEIEKRFIAGITGRTTELQQLCARASEQKLPLFQLVNEVITTLLCDKDGQYQGEEIAYINAFLDETRNYIATYGSGLEAFLLYWEDVLHGKSISVATTNAIRIMTIHASKGLQAKILFVPFCTWTKEKTTHPQKIWCKAAEELNTELKYVPIPDGADMEHSHYNKEYAYEHQNMRIDNLNMLYVALTRAEDELYISAEFPVNANGGFGAKADHIGMYILQYTGLVNNILRGENIIPIGEENGYAEYDVQCTKDNVQRTMYEVQCTKDENPFSFNGAENKKAEIWSNKNQVRFVQSQEGMLYTQMGVEAYRRMARMEEGTLCHNIFAQIQTKDQLEHVLDTFQQRGEIDTQEQRQTLRQLISSAWEGNAEMNSWFTDPWIVKREHAVFKDGKELRPDRVMINAQTNEAIVLDYKFGKENEKYTKQVRDYMEALQQMGHTHVRGYLWYARKPKGQQLKQIRKEENNG
ncbi:MAG: UvrD-helicase domain-containing protein [Paludibacteraceae bacterium]|nr:UvrD-helicase domain-containing protein [Paludibacteraceae bacterium]